MRVYRVLRSAAGAASTSHAVPHPLLITPSLLSSQLARSSNGQRIKILDASWHMPNSQRNALTDYKARRLPGAAFWDVDSVATVSEEGEKMGLKHMLPSAERFGEECERLGIGRDTKVVVYDSVGTWSAPRTLWTFKAFGHADACVLDGGLPRWLAEGFEVDDSSETGRRTLTPKSTSYSTPELLKSFVRDYPFMVENSKFDLVEDGEGGGQLVIDARAKGRFDGTAPEPRPNLSSGHIPNSINLPFTDLLTPPSDTNPPYQTLLPQDELRKVFERTMERYNIPPSSLTTRNFVTTCGSGMTAAIIWLALQVAGLKPDQVGLYDESWTGYAARKESKIVKS